MKIFNLFVPSARMAALTGGGVVLFYLLFSPQFLETLRNTKLCHLSRHPDLYGDVAANIAGGKGYRIKPESCKTMFREPGYILTVATVYAIFGENPSAARVVNVGLLALTSWLTLLLARKAGVSLPWARLAALFVLVYPNLIVSMLRVSPEVLFTALILGTLLQMTKTMDCPKVSNFILSGFFLALTALVRTIVLPFTLVFVIFAFYSLRRSIGVRSALASCIIFCLAFGMVFGIWPLRNYLLSGRLVVTATVSGDAIYQGMYTSKFRDSKLPYKAVLSEASKEQRKILTRAGIPYGGGFFQFHEKIEDELRHAAIFKAAVLAEYHKDPLLFINSVTRHIWSFWFKAQTRLSTLCVALYMLPLLLAAAFGLRRVTLYPRLKVTLLFMLTTYLTHLPVLAHSRHSVYMTPLLLVLGALNLPPTTDGDTQQKL